MQGTGNQRFNLIMLLLIILTSGLAIYSSLNINEVAGPTSLARSGNGDVVVALSDRFVVLDAYGGQKQSVMFEQAGIQGKIVDMQVLSNGDVIVGSGGERMLYRCDSSFFECERLWSDSETSYKPGRFFKFHIDESRQHILLSKTERHELVQLDMQGELMHRLFRTSDTLQFPDGIYPLSETSILLANSLGKEILEIDIAQGAVTILDRHTTDGVFVGVSTSLPMDLAQARNGDWWVTAQAATLNSDFSSVLVFDSDWVAREVLSHEAMRNPVDILNQGEVMLVADMYGFGLHAFDHDGDLLEGYVDAELVALLDSQKQMRSYYNVARLSSIVLIVVLLVIALVMESRRKKADEQEFETRYGDTSEIFIEIPSAIPTVFRLLPVLMIAVLVITGVMLINSSPELFRMLMTMMAPMFIALSVFSYMLAARIPASVEIKAGGVRVISSDGRQYESALPEVRYSSAAIWIDNNYFLFGRHGAFLKSRKKYEKLMSLLSAAQKLKESKAQLNMMRQDKWLYLILVASLVYTFIVTSQMETEDAKKESEVINKVLVSMKD